MGIQIRYEHGPDEHEIEVYEVKSFKEVLDEIDPRYYERLKQLSGRAVGDVLATAYFSDRSKLEDSRQHDIFAAYLEKLRGTDSQLVPYMFGVTNREITPVQRQVARGLAYAVHPLLTRGSNGVDMAETKVDETDYDSRSKVPGSTEQNHIDATDAEEKNQADSNVTPEQGVLSGAAYSEKPPIQNVNVHSETSLEKPGQVDLLAIAKGEMEAEEASRGALLPNKIAQPAVRQTVKPPIARMKPQYAPTPPAQRTVLGDGPLDSIDDLAIPQEDEKWQDKSLCAQTDPEIFFPEKGGSTRDAKRICRGCEVKAECLGYALDNDERFGIWGGLSERERRRLKRGIA